MPNIRPTRFYSTKQEKKVAKVLNGKTIANSGATMFSKGDVSTDSFLIECKTCTTRRKQFTLHKEWLDKLKEEAFAMGKYYNALVFDFGTPERYYVIDESLFKQLVSMLEDSIW